MEIRQLTSNDAAEYWELRLEALRLVPEAFAASYEESLQRPNPIEQVISNFNAEGSYTFGAFLNGKMTGMVTLVQDKHQKMKHRANLFAMYVSPANRKNGAGKALVATAIQKAKETPDIEKLVLTVNARNEKAIKLYTSLGFSAYGTEKRALNVDGTYYDEDLMELFIRS